MVQRINFEGKSYVNCGGILLPEFESKPRAQKAPKVTALTVVPKQEPYIPKNVAKKNNSGEGENSAK